MTKSLQNLLSKAYFQACNLELQALKPGNVHIFADGHGMTVHDFIKSAEVTRDIITQPDLSLGECVLQSVKATKNAVGCNTNLGIILLCAPLIHTAYQTHDTSVECLKANIEQTLKHSTAQDCALIFEAIALANPGGLGEVEKFDVRQAPQTNIVAAMQAAADRDLIAKQYSTGFEMIFNVAFPMYITARQRWNEAWATTALYLGLLSQMHDTHVLRKYGIEAAEKIRLAALQHFTNFYQLDNPKTYLGTLLAWDNQCKRAGYNMGTTADMVVCVLWLYENKCLNDNKNKAS